MGEFHEAVSTLLQAFSHGISIIKTQRSRRKRDKVPIDSPRKTAETYLSKTLKKSRADVRKAYEKDTKLLGPGFAIGDEEARSSLSSILLRLNAGFVSIIERFTRGKSTPTDYQALVNLSNSSRLEAMKTFEQLSQRLSHSSLTLAPPQKRRKRSKKGSSSTEPLRHMRSKSAPELALTPLGVASTEGWVRPKSKRKSSSESRSSGHSTMKRMPTKSQPQSSSVPQSPPLPKTLPQSQPPQSRPLHHRTPNRKSIMSFASNSTKIGEIPEHKWATPAMFYDEGVGFPVTAFYPIEPYREPEKQRSRFRRLFGG